MRWFTAKDTPRWIFFPLKWKKNSSSFCTRSKSITAGSISTVKHYLRSEIFLHQYLTTNVYALKYFCIWKKKMLVNHLKLPFFNYFISWNATFVPGIENIFFFFIHSFFNLSKLYACEMVLRFFQCILWLNSKQLYFNNGYPECKITSVSWNFHLSFLFFHFIAGD